MAVNPILATTSAAERETVTVAVPTETAPVVPKHEHIDFPVYSVWSKLSLSQMDKFIQEFGSAGFLRIVLDHEGKETDRTLAIMDDSTYEALVAAGYGEVKVKTSNVDTKKFIGFRASPFILKENNFPREGLDVNLFVPVPKHLSGDEAFVTDVVTEKLEHLAQWDIIPADSWKLTVPLASRETGGVRGGCFICFNACVPLPRVAMTRILLADTYWPESEEEVGTHDRSVFRCHWARMRDETEKPAHKKPFEKKPFVKRTPGKSPEKPVLNEAEKVKRQAILKMATSAVPATVKKAPTVPVTKQPVVKQ